MEIFLILQIVLFLVLAGINSSQCNFVYNRRNSTQEQQVIHITCPSGGLLVLGVQNTVNSLNSIIIGRENTVTTEGNDPTSDGLDAGNFVLGYNNTLQGNAGPKFNYNQCNMMVGNKNTIGGAEYTHVFGKII